MKHFIRITTIYSAMICLMLALCACGTQSLSNKGKGPDYNSLEFTGSMELSYASQFSVDYLGEYSLIKIGDNQKFLIVPEESEIPKNLPADIQALKQPLNNVYQVSSPIMDMIRELDCLDKLTFTGTKREDWCIDGIKERIDSGKLVYAGKYSQPDYELLLSKQCSLAIENTMIWHSPDTKEKLESLGIPVLVETSSYESHPLGRLEWIKLYGLLFNKTNEANEFFNNQLLNAQDYMDSEATGKSIAFFYVTSNGAVNVKKPGDYVAKIINMAGGSYLPDSIDEEEETALSTLNMTMEDFYAACKDADIIVYNSTIIDDVRSLEDLIGKSPLFNDFKAVKNKQVYITGANFYQETTGVCRLIEDINKVVRGNEENLYFLKHLD